MHLEIHTEDSSTKELLEVLLPKIVGNNGAANSWRIHSYKGIGRLPKNLDAKADPAKRFLLDQLPSVLKGYGKTQGAGHVVIVVDADDRDCKGFLDELQGVLSSCNPAPETLFRIVIEETESWYFGDSDAILKAYPKAKRTELNKYIQDSVCGTWERLADALVAGGSVAVKKNGSPHAGDLKHEWARNIGPHMNPDNNTSPSFKKFRDGLRRITQHATVQS
jgi:Domain of unknown function (DUF4276)